MYFKMLKLQDSLVIKDMPSNTQQWIESFMLKQLFCLADLCSRKIKFHFANICIFSINLILTYCLFSYRFYQRDVTTSYTFIDTFHSLLCFVFHESKTQNMYIYFLRIFLTQVKVLYRNNFKLEINVFLKSEKYPFLYHTFYTLNLRSQLQTKS